jgi:hypothetical protein
MMAESQNSETNGCRRYRYFCKHVSTATESRDDNNRHEEIKRGYLEAVFSTLVSPETMYQGPKVSCSV